MQLVDATKVVDQLSARVPRSEADLWVLVRELASEVDQLKKEMKELRARATPEPCEVREVPGDEAERLILAYYDERPGEALYPSDVAEALHLDAYAVFEITNRLAAEGRLR